MTSPVSLHLTSRALPSSRSDSPFFKPQGRLHSAEFQLLLPASDCLLPTAKVILSVIQLKLLYFLIAGFLLSVVPSVVRRLPPQPPQSIFTDIATRNGSWENWVKRTPGPTVLRDEACAVLAAWRGGKGTELSSENSNKSWPNSLWVRFISVWWFFFNLQLFIIRFFKK